MAKFTSELCVVLVIRQAVGVAICHHLAGEFSSLTDNGFQEVLLCRIDFQLCTNQKLVCHGQQMSYNVLQQMSYNVLQFALKKSYKKSKNVLKCP